MDTLTLKEKIKGLDPELHKSLISALLEKYDNQTVKQKQDDSQNEHDPNVFEKLFREVIAEIKISYINGTIDYINDHHPDLYRKPSR